MAGMMKKKAAGKNGKKQTMAQRMKALRARKKSGTKKR